MSKLSKELIRQIIADGEFSTPNDIGEYLKDMFKDVIQEMLEKELALELGYEKGDSQNKNTDNRRNGYSKKTVKSQFGNIELDIPRDRNSEYNPKVIPKHTKNISGLEEKIISLYARGMSTRDIHDQIKDLYGIEISAEYVSHITDVVIEQARLWQNRPLESVYPFIFMDAIHYKVREDSKIKNKAVYVILGVNKDGFKDILGLWIGESETSKFWYSILTDLKNRGVKEILIACMDGLKGLPQAIQTVFPSANIQTCIVHQIRNSIKYIASKDKKSFMKDLKEVYKAPTEELALAQLDKLKETWGNSYGMVIDSWYNNWNNLSTFFDFSPRIRKMIYTTNALEGFNRQVRKYTKSRTIFPTDESLNKCVYLATMEIMEKWTQPVPNWGATLAELTLFFTEELKDELA